MGIECLYLTLRSLLLLLWVLLLLDVTHTQNTQHTCIHTDIDKQARISEFGFKTRKTYGVCTRMQERASTRMHKWFQTHLQQIHDLEASQ